MRSTKWLSNRKNFFFQVDHLACEVGDSPRQLLRGNGIALAELDAPTQAGLILQSDHANTALRIVPEGLPQNYTPYGFLHTLPASQLVAYSGQRLDQMLHCYPLGNGHRFYSPTLRRFIQPDTQSPFRKGGTNGYSYCQNDPINRNDPTGQFWELFSRSVQRGVSRAVNWVVGQLPRISVVRPLLSTSNGNRTVQHLDPRINSYRAGQTPPPNAPHVTLQVNDIEVLAHGAREILGGADDLRVLWTGINTRFENAAVSGVLGYGAYVVSHGVLGAAGVPFGFAVGASTFAYLEFDVFRDVILQFRTGTNQMPHYPYSRYHYDSE
ncbi:RHS repeat-associated core domain-containing protein [Pseudomonas putida]|uniref:RHS repeat-associated core domain-containing protein n=1 Tax=Pseudomonas putida TaxID=303 RepID=UPI002263DF42|nr:RHS repeat-associated core domain-containing protein [Pseudomonas putida]